MRRPCTSPGTRWCCRVPTARTAHGMALVGAEGGAYPGVFVLTRTGDASTSILIRADQSHPSVRLTPPFLRITLNKTIFVAIVVTTHSCSEARNEIAVSRNSA